MHSHVQNYRSSYTASNDTYSHKTDPEHIKKNQQLTSSMSGESAPWSNAFNFKKAFGIEVDPRTGILSAYIKAGNLLSNLGHGPNIDLEVNYNNATLTSADGLGKGWSWNLTHFNPVTHQLTTSNGQNFYLQKQTNGHWWPMYHKLQDMSVEGDINTHFVITYANGLRETLNHSGYEIALQQQNGWGVHFIYIGKHHLLHSVVDDEGHQIDLHYNKNHITVISRGNSGQEVPVLIFVENNELRHMMLPLKKGKGAEINIHYTGNLINEMDYPTGLKNKIQYDCNAEMKVVLQKESLPSALCVVSRQTVDPGTGMPEMTTRYRYSTASGNEHNYLGFNAGVSAMHHSYRDILFEAPVSYTYRTVQDNGIVNEILTYNKYHLLIDDRQVDNYSGRLLAEIQNFFCSTEQTDGCARTSFDQLPSTYSLPLKIVTKTWGPSSGLPAISTVTATYDQQGRVITQTDSYGRVNKINYCPEQGDAVCPKPPQGWPVNTLIKSVISYPAREKGQSALPAIIIHNYYKKEANYNGKGYTLVLDYKVIQSGEQYLKTTNHYYNDDENPLTWGRLKQQVAQDNSATSSLIRDYHYIQSSDGKRETTYSVIELENNKFQPSSVVTTSLFTGQILKSVDPAGKNITRYHYDLWGRPVKTDFAVETPFEVSLHYKYTTSPTLNQILITAPNGLQHKVIFDSAGRELMQFDEALTTEGKLYPGHWWLKGKTVYDNYGRIAKQYAYIIKPSGSPQPLVITQDYDASGRPVRVHLPDDEIAITLYDDALKCVVSYRQDVAGKRSVISVTRANTLNQPVKQWLLPATKDRLPALKTLCLDSDKQKEARVSSIIYDGFGRQITSRDPAGRVVKWRYDAMGRLTDTIDPIGNRTHQVYDLTGQVIKNEIFPVAGGHYLLASAAYNHAGQPVWQAGEDGKRTFYSYNINGQPETIITPAGHHFAWQYNVLGLPVSELADNKEQWHAYYDLITKRIIRKTDVTGTTTYRYSADGLRQQLIHIGKNGYRDYQLHWKYDNNRRMISSADIQDNRTISSYDALGRMVKVHYRPVKGEAETLYSTVYDGFSRIASLHYGSGMQRIIKYDHWGHLDNITDTLGDQLISHWQFSYDIEDNISTLKQIAQKGQKALLHYHYDTLNNLVSMICQGSAGLPLCPRDTAFSNSGLRQAPVITRQDYTFTSMNRIATVKETLLDILQHKTLMKTTDYQYNNIAVPLRLQKISVSWNQNKPVTHTFAYDMMGNMTTDGEGNHMVYNAFNQVVQVTNSSGQQSHYFYDGSGKEVEEKNTAHTSYLFYAGDSLINEDIHTLEEGSHITGYQGAAKTKDGIVSEYDESNYKGDITAVLKKVPGSYHQYQLRLRNVYSPYGMRWHAPSKQPLTLYQQTLTGFNGERTDPATGWQFLGAGHRSYNPKLRCFVSEDPAGDGYAFGSNNPIMNADPSGNMPQWMGSALKWASYATTFGLGAFHRRWTNVMAAVIGAGLTAVSLGASIASEGASAMTAVLGGVCAASSIPVVSAAIPANKGLGIASSVVGIAQLAATVVAGAALSFFSTPVAESITTESIEMDSFPPAPGADLAIYRMLRASTSTDTSEAEDIPIPLPFLLPLYTAYIMTDDVASSYGKLEGALIERFPDLIIRKYDTSCLNLTYESDVINVWSFLRSSPFKDACECDIGVILKVAQINKKPLRIENLENFMVARSLSIDPKMEDVSIYFESFKGILDTLKKHYSNRSFRIVYPAYDSINKLKTSINNSFVVGGAGHVAVVERLTYIGMSRWKIYHFNQDGTVTSSINDSETASSYFSDASGVSINGYMRIG